MNFSNENIIRGTNIQSLNLSGNFLYDGLKMLSNLFYFLVLNVPVCKILTFQRGGEKKGRIR